MNAHHPSRLALAVFDCFVADNEPLKGDLIEEFETRRSQWWLWRQVIGAIVCQRGLRALPRERTDLIVLGAAVLVLLSFEAVFMLASMHAPLVAIAASVPTAWLISRFHQRHYALSRSAFAVSVMVCTVLSIQLSFGIQFLTTLVFIVGLLMSGCLAVTIDQRYARAA